MKDKITSIQMLRGLSAFVVCIMHVFDSKSWVNQGDTNPIFFQLGRFFNSFGGNGVDTFFCISGFIIYRMAVKNYQSPSFVEPFKFAIGRAFRIYPLFWITLLVMTWFNYHFGVQFSEIKHAFSPGVLLLLTKSIPFQAPAWSLAFEIWFYLGTCFLLMIAPSDRLIIAFMCWGGAQVGLLLLQISGHLSTDFFPLADPKVLEFFVGIFVARMLTIKISQTSVFDKVFAFVAFVILFGYGVFIVYSRPVGGQLGSWERFWFAGIPSAALIYSLVGLEKLRKFKPPRALSYLGDISYSLYLWQFPAMCFWLSVGLKVHAYMGLNPVIRAVVDAGTTLVFAVFSFRFIERPFIALSHRLAAKIG